MDRINLVRIGALLHNIEDSTSFNIVLKKLVDFTFASKNTTVLEVNTIIDFISSEDGICMNFSQSEIIDCCKEFESVYTINGNKDVESILISDEHLVKINEKINEIGLDKMIDKFYHEIIDSKKRVLFKRERISEAIYLFLYNVLIESKIEYSKLFSIDLVEVVRIVKKPEYADIVNDFIQWEDEYKNQILFSLYGAGLEFSILSVKKNLVNLKAFSNKTLYLDTNVLFRLLGLNGEELSKRTEDFLKKFKQLGMNLRISTLTKKEFDETIKQKVIFIIENMHHSSKYTIDGFERLDRDNYSIFQYYLDWKVDKPGVKVMSLIPYINALLKKAITKFDISLESKFDKSNIDEKELSTQINEYKKFRYHNRKTDKLIENDIKNYCYMLALRSEIKITDFSSVDYYLLSTDYELLHFDNNSKDNFRVVFHPARLYSIILQFGGRINTTELMSFIRMLKVDIKTDEKLSESTRLIINDHLNFYESDESMQQPYIDALIESQMLDQIEMADITEKRTLLNAIFEKVSKAKAEEISKKLHDRDQEVIDLKFKLEQSEKFKLRFKFILSVILKLVISSIVFIAIYLISKQFLQDALVFAISICGSLLTFILFIFKKE